MVAAMVGMGGAAMGVPALIWGGVPALSVDMGGPNGRSWCHQWGEDPINVSVNWMGDNEPTLRSTAMMAAMVGMGGAPMGVSVGTWGEYGGDIGGGAPWVIMVPPTMGGTH